MAYQNTKTPELKTEASKFDDVLLYLTLAVFFVALAAL